MSLLLNENNQTKAEFKELNDNYNDIQLRYETLRTMNETQKKVILFSIQFFFFFFLSDFLFFVNNNNNNLDRRSSQINDTHCPTRSNKCRKTL